jgi:hypothetical protein
MYRDSIKVANDIATAALAVGSTTMYIGFTNGIRQNFGGDIDEFMVWNSALVQATVTQHYQGNYFNQLSSAGGMLMWFKFNEGGGSTITDSIGGNVLTFSGTSSPSVFQSNSVSPVCITPFWNSYSVSVSSSAAISGTIITVTVTQLDQRNLPTTTTTGNSVTLHFIGSGSSLPFNTIISFGTIGYGTTTFTDNISEVVSFSLIDTQSNGRSTTITSPTVTFTATACTISAPTNGVLTGCTTSISSGTSCSPTCNTGFQLTNQFTCLNG